MPRYLRPTAPIAADALLPADPGLAMAIAQRALVKPLMANHHHGLWGYSGTTASGLALTIQATGIGGPSAAAVLGELAGHGARRLIGIGRCAALTDELRPGDRLVAAEALGADGVSAALGEPGSRADAALAGAAAAAAGATPAAVASADLPVAAIAPELIAEWRRRGALAVDLETAALLAIGARLEIAVAAVLIVSESTGGRLDDDALGAELVELGAALVPALEALERAPG
ncbi:MAG: hypothetical protein ABWZ43_03915 [Solirubrobacterales bacterium]